MDAVVKQLKDAGYTAAQLNWSGYNAAHLQYAGYTAAQMLQGHYTIMQLKCAGYSAAQMLQAQCTIAQLKDAGYTDTQLLHTGCAAAQLRQAGYIAAQLKDAGYTITQLKDAGYTQVQLLQAGYTLVHLKDAGYTAAQLRSSGHTAAHLKDAGYTAVQLCQAQYTIAQLNDAGYTDAQVLQAGYTAAQLREASAKLGTSFGSRIDQLPGDLENRSPNSTGSSWSSTGSSWCRGAVKAKSHARLAPIVDMTISPFACNGVVRIPCVPEVTFTESGDMFEVMPPVTTSPPHWGATLHMGEKQFDSLNKMLLQLPNHARLISKKSVGNGKANFDKPSPSILELNANMFSVNIPVDTLDVIVNDVREKLRVSTQLIAEPYTLDVFLEKGKLAKHRVAPFFDDMIGILVICLPAYFTGGAMLVMQGVETRTFFQSSGCSCEKPLPSSDSLQWCAFFTGADVEIKEIRKGVRITVTYLLRRASDDGDQEQSKASPLSPSSQKLQQLNLSRFDLISHPLFAKMSVSSRSSDELLKEIRLHEQMWRAFEAGDMPALRKTVAKARFSISPGQTHEIATELARTTQDMIACENAWRSYETTPSEKHESRLCQAVKQMRTSRIGPGLWNDPLYPIMAQIRQDPALAELATTEGERVRPGQEME